MPDTNLDSDLTVASEPVAEGSLLKQHVEAIEHLEEEKAAIADTIKERFAALKADGFDTKAVKAIIAERRRSRTRLASSKYSSTPTRLRSACGSDQARPEERAAAAPGHFNGLNMPRPRTSFDAGSWR
jgi:uncharacterized protein (UPF0335 family)